MYIIEFLCLNNSMFIYILAIILFCVVWYLIYNYDNADLSTEEHNEQLREHNIFSLFIMFIGGFVLKHIIETVIVMLLIYYLL